MWQKTKISLLIIIAIVFNVTYPSIPALAYAAPIYGVTTLECVQDEDFGLPLTEWSGGGEGNGAELLHFVRPTDAFPITKTTYDQRNFLQCINKIGDLGIDLQDYYYALCTSYNANLYTVTLYTIPKSGTYFDGADVFGTYNTFNGASTGSGSNGCAFFVQSSTVSSDVTRLPISFYSSSYSNGTWSNFTTQNDFMGRSSVDNQGSIFYYSFSNIGNCYNLLSSNMDFFFLGYAQWDKMYRDANQNWITPQMNPTVFANIHFGTNHEYPKGTTGWFNLENAPFYNGSEIVEPAPSFDEIPENKQIAFKSIDLLQVYDRGTGAQTDARLDWTMDDQSFDFSDYPTGWRMNYMLHISFQINESSDYRVFKPTTNKLYGDVYIPYDYPVNGDFTFSEILLGHSTFQLKDALQVEGAEFYGSEGAVGALALFAYAASQNTSFAFEAMSFTTGALEGFLQAAGLQFPTDIAYDITLFAQNNFTNSKAGYAYVLNQLQYDVTARCYNPSAGLKSRLGEASVNMISGQHSGTAPGAVVKDQDDNDVQLPSYKNTGDDYLSISYDASGNPVYVVNNVTLPSGAGGSSSSVSSGGNAYASVTVPERIEIVQDTLKQFAELMSQPAENVQSSFWGFFGLFKDNPIADIYGDYFGFLPEGFKNYILALCGISFGVVCFSAIRRRLT